MTKGLLKLENNYIDSSKVQLRLTKWSDGEMNITVDGCHIEILDSGSVKVTSMTYWDKVRLFKPKWMPRFVFNLIKK